MDLQKLIAQKIEELHNDYSEELDKEVDALISNLYEQ
jgi:hypothetical protein